MNKVILSGNICKDIELRKTKSGESVVSNTIAVRRDFKESDGNYGTDFINIVVWKQSADYLTRFANKGDKVELVGRWSVRSYQDKHNATIFVNECVVESISIISSKREDNEEEVKESNVNQINDEDLPF